MAPLGVVGHCEERLLACIRYLFPIPGVVGKKVGSVGWRSEVTSQNDTTVVEPTFQETEKTDLQPNEGFFHIETKIKRCRFLLGTCQ